MVCVIFFKALSLIWNFILISAKNKHKIDKCWFWIEVLCVIFLKEVFFEWNFILISPKIKHNIEKILILNRTVMCHIFQGGIFWIKYHTNFSHQLAQNWKILIWNLSVMCHISQGGIFWIKFDTNFSQKICTNLKTFDFE